MRPGKSLNKSGLSYRQEKSAFHLIRTMMSSLSFTIPGVMPSPKIRGLLKTIPIQRVDRSEETRALVELIIKVLNRGLRPHLTRWQARFRTWYEQAKGNAENKDQPPQLIQRRFPEYEELKCDLQEVQSGMVEYTKFLSKVARGEG